MCADRVEVQARSRSTRPLRHDSDNKTTRVSEIFYGIDADKAETLLVASWTLFDRDMS